MLIIAFVLASLLTLNYDSFLAAIRNQKFTSALILMIISVGLYFEIQDYLQYESFKCWIDSSEADFFNIMGLIDLIFAGIFTFITIFGFLNEVRMSIDKKLKD